MICQEITQKNLVNKIVLDSLERTRKLCHDDQADENCKWLQNETPASLEYNISYLRHGIFETIPVESMIDCVRNVLIMLWDKQVGVCDLIRMSFGFP